MKYILMIILALFVTGCNCDNKAKGKPYYSICDDGSCSDTYTYTNDNGCLTYQKFNGDYKTSCGEVRIYYENGAKPIIRTTPQPNNSVEHDYVPYTDLNLHLLIG